MRKVFRGLVEFMRELDRGQAMMRGEVEPGTYHGRQRGRRQGHWNGHRRDRRCDYRPSYIRRRAVGQGENGRFGE